MKLHDLKAPEGARRKRKRVGRGIASGQGKTAGRGTKGQNARSGGGVPAYFEGGQLPLSQRLPHRPGFTNIWRIPFVPVNLDVLESAFQKGDEVTPEALVEAGLIKSTRQPVKILGRGELKTALTVRAHAFSASARAKIEQAGGKALALGEPEASGPANRAAPKRGESEPAVERARAKQARPEPPEPEEG